MHLPHGARCFSFLFHGAGGLQRGLPIPLRGHFGVFYVSGGRRLREIVIASDSPEVLCTQGTAKAHWGLAKWPHTHVASWDGELVANAGAWSPWPPYARKGTQHTLPQRSLSFSPAQLGRDGRYIRLRRPIHTSPNNQIGGLQYLRWENTRLASYTSVRDTAPKTGVAVLGYSDTEVESSAFKVIGTNDITSAKRRLQVRATQPW